MHNTLYIYLTLIAGLLLIGLIAGILEREWAATLQAIYAGIGVITAICWPIGIAVGVIGTFWDFFLQLLGWRNYDLPQRQLRPAVAELATAPSPLNPYEKN